MDYLFVELLQIALGNKKTLSRIPSDKEWVGLLSEAKWQAVVGVLTDGLEKQPQEQRPRPEIFLQWLGLAQITEDTYTLHVERAKELTNRFAEGGFRTCVLKGIGIAQLYPNPARRQCGDIDLWVDGGEKEVREWLQTQCKVGKLSWLHADAEFFEDVQVEVHFHPSWLYAPVCNKRLQRWFERNKGSQMVVNRDLGIACPTARFNAIYSLVHAFHHLMEEGVGMRHVVDYYYILKALPISHHDEVMRVLNYIGLGKFAAAMMWLLAEVCGMDRNHLFCEPNEKEGRFLLDEIKAGGNFGQSRQDCKQRNTFARWCMMVRHYSSESLWMIPWKVWHRGWMRAHN